MEQHKMDPGKAHVETLTETRTKNAKTALLRNDFQFSATLSKHTAVVHTARRVVRQIPACKLDYIFSCV